MMGISAYPINGHSIHHLTDSVSWYALLVYILYIVIIYIKMFLFFGTWKGFYTLECVVKKTMVAYFHVPADQPGSW